MQTEDRVVVVTLEVHIVVEVMAMIVVVVMGVEVVW